MPQMAPLYWTSLYIYFMFLFILCTILNHFLFFYFPSFNFKKKMNKKYLWKW
uniref:ATP synthase F0 subunit 8 n=1 Tax=Campyloscelina sp. AH-2016 TaxID=1903844 RepID=A0A343C4F5_9CUCU|nr:ATP synthase F0 subunit 8 [Campyloscelina sp. AH-2016]